MIILLAAGFVFIALRDIPGLVRRKYWKELAVFLVLYAGGLALALLMYWNVKIPSPIMAIQHFFMDVLHLTYQ